MLNVTKLQTNNKIKAVVLYQFNYETSYCFMAIWFYG